MTSRSRTNLLSVDTPVRRPLGERLRTIAWGAIQWPWLLRSLWGGRLADKHALLDRLDLPHDALPHLGSWKADTGFLWHIVREIERARPAQVVELGCGASSLVIARALQRNGGGHLTSFDQHADFVAATSEWLASHGLDADIVFAPIGSDPSEWSSLWYLLPDRSSLPAQIDLLVVDGPPWALNPLVRGRAEKLFPLVAPGGTILLDDAARPGERAVARKWRQRWPDFRFELVSGIKGTLVGRRDAEMQSADF